MTCLSLFQRARMTATIVASLFVFSYAAAGRPENVHVTYDASSRVFRMDAADVTYVLGVNEVEQVQTLYWGKRLSSGDAFPAAHSPRGSSSFDSPVTVTPHEFAGWGGGLYLEPDLKITFPDGNRDLALKYFSYKIEGDALSILMKDISREVYVTLHYAMDDETGIICRGAEIENRTGAPFTIEQLAAGTYNLPHGTDYHLHFFTGRWAGEWNVQDDAIRGGKIVLESRRGSTGSQNNPFFADRKSTRL